MINNLSTLKVGERVGVAYSGSWTTTSQGVYLVKNVNKVRIIIARESDGYERTFSTRTGVEKGSERYRTAFLETVAEMEQRNGRQQKERDIRVAWGHAEDASKRSRFDDLLVAVDELKVLLGKS